MKDHNTEDWSNDAENTALITGIHLILNYIQTEMAIVIIFHNFTVFTAFLIKYMPPW